MQTHYGRALLIGVVREMRTKSTIFLNNSVFLYTACQFFQKPEMPVFPPVQERINRAVLPFFSLPS